MNGLLPLLLLAALQTDPPALDDWTARHLEAFQDAAVPFVPPAAKASDAEWVVSARAVPAFDQPVVALVLIKRHDGGVQGTLTMAEEPLGPELQALHLAFPDASPAELAPRARVSRLAATSATCPALKGLARDFEALRIPALPQNFLTVDPVSYLFGVSTYHGEPRLYSVLEPPGTYWGKLGAFPDPLVSWFKRTRAALRLCSGEPAPPASRRPRAH